MQCPLNEIYQIFALGLRRSDNCLIEFRIEPELRWPGRPKIFRWSTHYVMHKPVDGKD